MSTSGAWRDLLTGAGPGDWSAYREALDAFREVPPVLVFAKLQALGDQVVSEVEGLERSPSAGTWHKVFSSSWQGPPDWLYVELFVHVWAKQHQQPVGELLGEWAAGYRRCGGDPGPRFAPPAPVPDPVRRERLSRGTLLLSGVAALAVVAASVVFWPMDNDTAHGSKGKAQSSAPVSEVPSATGRPGGPLLLTTSWPTLAHCDGATSVAMPAGGEPLAAFLRDDQDFRVPVTANGGGTWGAGHLYLTFSAKPGKTLVIEDIRPATRYPRKIAPPAWVATVQGGCGNTYGRVFGFNLDKPDLVDHGVVGQRFDDEDPVAPSNPLGPGFTVSAADPAMVRVEVEACKGNYEWSLLVNYSYDGKRFSELVGPFRSMSVAGKDTVGYVPDPSTGILTKDSQPGPAPEAAVGCPARAVG